MSNFTERLLVSITMALVVMGMIYFSDISYMRPIFTLATALLVSVALWELYHIATKNGYKPLTGLGIAGTVAYFYAWQEAPFYPALPYLILFLLLAIGFLYYFFLGERPLENLSVTYFGLVYLTLPLSFLLLINFHFGRAALLYLILVTKLTDTGAYFIGKKWGRTKLAPYISPNKTWEGAVGGFFVGVLASIAFIPVNSYSLLTAVSLGAILALMATFGDLTESLLKRDLGVKDSSHLPGLGGFLDLVDSLIFTTPCLYFYLNFVERA